MFYTTPTNEATHVIPLKLVHVRFGLLKFPLARVPVIAVQRQQHVRVGPSPRHVTGEHVQTVGVLCQSEVRSYGALGPNQSTLPNERAI